MRIKIIKKELVEAMNNYEKTSWDKCYHASVPLIRNIVNDQIRLKIEFQLDYERFLVRTIVDMNHNEN